MQNVVYRRRHGCLCKMCIYTPLLQNVQEGYLVYECNNMCRCDRTCPNRVLQNGVQVKLEVFMTESKVILSLFHYFQELYVLTHICVNL